MAGLGGPELLLVAGVIVLLFGSKKLPEFARSLGKAKQEFKKGIDEQDQQVTDAEPVVTRTD
ncbi:twin-arginine translocase TatA/TatE family subunit [soil metagenome]